MKLKIGISQRQVFDPRRGELFDTLDDTVLDFTESNPFGDAGVFA